MHRPWFHQESFSGAAEKLTKLLHLHSLITRNIHLPDRLLRAFTHGCQERWSRVKMLSSHYLELPKVDIEHTEHCKQYSRGLRSFAGKAGVLHAAIEVSWMQNAMRQLDRPSAMIATSTPILFATMLQLYCNIIHFQKKFPRTSLLSVQSDL